VDSARLYQSIQALFDGFVRASVVAIEARDPTTSGHSFRVADLTVALAEVVDRVDHGPYAGIRFSADQLRELRYASLLHDFGKVGVPDQVLVKAKKLLPGRLELIRERVDRFKAGLALKTARHKIGWLLAHGAADFERESGRLDAEFSTMLDTLDRYLEVAVTANEPSVLPAPVAELLAEMTSTRFEDHQGVSGTVITPDEAGILSIPLGSLTDEERRQIQGHVVHTFQFLSQIPWTSDLRRVPEIARSHHEKLNGSGYPYGIKGDDIPIQSRMMSVADIYDALTAADRPYKRAMSVERALDILVAETKAGAIEGGLLDLFIDSQVFKCIGPSR
jgi:response regulator RpfG family c-di-GMP phosphodiesterase